MAASLSSSSSYNYSYAQSSKTHCSHRGKSGLRRRCVTMVKQQKTRFYILGRCITMLLCWHAHDLSD